MEGDAGSCASGAGKPIARLSHSGSLDTHRPTHQFRLFTSSNKLDKQALKRRSLHRLGPQCTKSKQEINRRDLLTEQRRISNFSEYYRTHKVSIHKNPSTFYQVSILHPATNRTCTLASSDAVIVHVIISEITCQTSIEQNS